MIGDPQTASVCPVSRSLAAGLGMAGLQGMRQGLAVSSHIGLDNLVSVGVLVVVFLLGFRSRIFWHIVILVSTYSAMWLHLVMNRNSLSMMDLNIFT